MTNSIKNQTSLDPELLFSHHFDAPREKVFQAWTQEELFQQWFCPNDFSVQLCEMDVRPGGSFRIHMQAPDDKIYPTRGEYIEIIAPERLEYKDSWDDNRADNPPITITVTFEQQPDGTQLNLYTAFTSKEHRDQVLSQGVKEGWLMFMDNLTRHLENRS